MPRSSCILWSAFLLALFAATRAVGADVTIRGAVIDENGEAVAEATPELVALDGVFETDLKLLRGDDAKPLRTTRCDARGFFELPATAGGSYRLRVASDDRLPMEVWLPHVVQDRARLGRAGADGNARDAGDDPRARASQEPAAHHRCGSAWYSAS